MGSRFCSIVGAIDAAPIMAHSIYITMFTHWGELAGLKTKHGHRGHGPSRSAG